MGQDIADRGAILIAGGQFEVRRIVHNGRIELDAEGYVPGLRHGSQANVIIYTGDNSIANWLGELWIRLVSVLTYAT